VKASEKRLGKARPTADAAIHTASPAVAPPPFGKGYSHTSASTSTTKFTCPHTPRRQSARGSHSLDDCVIRPWPCGGEGELHTDEIASRRASEP
jgi:hypothetical protein